MAASAFGFGSVEEQVLVAPRERTCSRTERKTFPNREEAVALGAWCADLKKQTRKALPGHLVWREKSNGWARLFTCVYCELHLLFLNAEDRVAFLVVVVVFCSFEVCRGDGDFF